MLYSHPDFDNLSKSSSYISSSFGRLPKKVSSSIFMIPSLFLSVLQLFQMHRSGVWRERSGIYTLEKDMANTFSFSMLWSSPPSPEFPQWFLECKAPCPTTGFNSQKYFYIFLYFNFPELTLNQCLHYYLPFLSSMESHLQRP